MFATPAGAYDRFMGRWSRLLSPQLADLAGVRAGQRALDVGCGPGALLTELVGRLGTEAVAGIDPSASYVSAALERHPGVDVRVATAEQLPFADHAFDVALAQLVVHFMADPVAGLREMTRVTRAGGVVAACVWDYAGHEDPLRVFWAAARARDPGVGDESDLAGVREGHLGELFEAAGLGDIESSALVVELEHPDFDAWWRPFTEGVGPAGSYLAKLDPPAREALRDACRSMLPGGPFVLDARAWAARGVVSSSRS
jgi:SAM-dependent methyltransferase